MSRAAISFLRRSLRAVLPNRLRSRLSTAWFLHRYAREYGLWRSRLEQRVVDKDGRPVPWYTYAAIEYLDSLDWSDRTVFEYGCGQSTHWWAERAKSVTAVEHNADWYRQVTETAPGNVTLLLETDDYVQAIASRGSFDVIIIDGVSRSRNDCAALVSKHLAPGGIVVFDNSDRYPEACHYLRDQELLQVDFHGPVPMGAQTNTTSLLLHRDFMPVPASGRLPVDSLCGMRYVSQHDRYPEPYTKPR
jgi:hypothetical protein